MKPSAELIATNRKDSMRRLGSIVNYGLISLACLVFLVPFLWMIATALKPDQEVMHVPLSWIGSSLEWDNYLRAWRAFPFGRFIFNDLFVSILGTLLTLVTSSMAAYAFSRLRFAGRDKIFIVYLATLMIPQQVIVIPMFLLMKYLGWVNTYQALIVPWAFTAFGTFLLRQFFMQIPFEFDEAARIEGSSHFAIYLRVVVPLAKPGFATLGVFTFISYWNNFLWPLIITNNMSLYTLPLGLQMFQGQYGTAWNLLMAAATISVVPALLLYLFAQRYIVLGVTFSGLGGR